ncbi:spore germination protein KC [Anaerotaenia torta]|uniref:Ger(x)C family spore germination protein n=1 Tax=Anaerotaenia torta TaxID=433293 RepID=UPI003D1CAA2C
MKRRMFPGILSLLLCGLLCGCTHDMNRKEIDEIDLALVLGIDYSDSEYELSALYSAGGGADSEEGGASGEEKLAKGKGGSMYEALEDLKQKNRKNITLAQAGSFLIGEAAAEQGLDRCLDFLKRDETVKMEALLYIVKGTKAIDFMEEGIKQEQVIHEDLKAIQQKQKELLTRNDNTFVNILNDMEQSYSGILLPYITATEAGFLIEGYGVFQDLKLADYLDTQTSDGVNFIRNTMRSYPIYLPEGVSLAISYTNTKLKTEWKDNVVTVTIQVYFETMLKEINRSGNVFNRRELLRLTEEQNNYIRAVLEKPVQYSHEKGTDILNLARMVENQNVRDWKGLEKNWKEIIPEIQYRYEVRSQITKSFILGENTENY